jgi:hypothetical protein
MMETDDLEEKYLNLLCCYNCQSTLLGLTLLGEEGEYTQQTILCRIAAKIFEIAGQSPFFGYGECYGAFFSWGYRISGRNLLSIGFGLTGGYYPKIVISFEGLKFSSAIVRTADEHGFASDVSYPSLGSALKAFINGK